MDISNIGSDRLKQILNEKREKIEEIYNSNDYLWIKNNRKIEDDYYNLLVKYRYYIYKTKALNSIVNVLYRDIIKIENELELRETTLDNLLLKKRFDKDYIL